MAQAWMRTFRNPDARFRGKPFWAWNGKLDSAELRRQVRVMHRMGLGGFFMHARTGLATAYLSDEWFACVRACIDEARRHGMQAWLYDEDGWPSGTAAGRVTRNPAFRRRRLVLQAAHRPANLRWRPETVAAFVARLDGQNAFDVRRVSRGRRPGRLGRGEAILVFTRQVEDPKTLRKGYAYLDTLNPAAVREFIRLTHEPYRRRVGEHFGGTVPGIFTDEPGPPPMLRGTTGWDKSPLRIELPWTDGLPDAFRRRYGYDVVDRLPALVFNVDGREIDPARVHYHDCVTHLFVDAFSRQIGDWCAEHGLVHTGHVLAEDRLSSQTGSSGSCMRFYEHMQAPGMDLLTEYARGYDAAKQVSSAARQFGRTWRMTETYGVTGWDFSLAGHKALADWQVALGMNLRCQHLSWYTMQGESKRDYPASILHQSPWWELYGKVEDYFARVGAVMTRGAEVRDLLVIHPVESMWTLCRLGWKSGPTLADDVRAYDQMLVCLRDTLLCAHLDFDYGDEEILSRRARVTGRRRAARLLVGRAAYRAVLVPELKTMRASTVRLLRRFHRAGGLVVFAGEAAEHVDAMAGPAARNLARACIRAPAQGDEIVRALAPICRRVSVTDARGLELAPVLYLLREDRGAHYLFLCNTGRDPRGLGNRDLPVRERTFSLADVRVRGFAGARGAPIELDPEDGATYAADARRRDGLWEIRTSLPALGSRLFVVPKRKLADRPPARPRRRTVRTRTLRKDGWTAVLSEDNVLVLDRPEYKIGARRWRGPEEVLRVDRAVREALGLPPRGPWMPQPWRTSPPADPPQVPLALRYRFQVDAVPTGALYLGLEQAHRFEIALNGASVSTDADAGWWCDRSLRRISLDPALLRKGENELRLACRYDETHSGLETMFLLGRFGARARDTRVRLTALPQKLTVGDWTRQGLRFYAGAVTYERDIRPRLARGERLFVQVPAYRGAAVRILVDGRCAGVIAWPPNEVDVTDLLSGGSARLGIQVFAHRRNSHGPLHLNEAHPRWTGFMEFVTTGDRWTDAYRTVPCGLTAPPRLEVRK